MPRCQQCQNEIEPHATRCPHCGYNPAQEGRIRRGMLKVVGFVLCISVVGAPIGIPLLWFADLQNRKAEQRTPTQSS